MRHLAGIVVLAALQSACATARPASALSTGAVVGVVRAADTGAPVPGVVVRVRGQRVGAQTDSLGRYRITGIESTAGGTVFLEAARIGYFRERSEWLVRAGPDTLDFRLRPRPARLVE